MYDLVLMGGTIINGLREKPYHANICIKDGRIAKISQQAEAASEIIDVTGRVISPGFIDIHAHSDSSPLVGYITESKIAQGITTEISGNCGISCLPATPEHLREINEYFATTLEMPLFGLQPGRMSMTDYVRDVKERGTILNCGMLVGHGTLRLAVMGFVNRDPNREEMEKLKELLERELLRGAFGMSLGLIYPPSAFSKKQELIELAKVLKKHEAILTVHMRSEGERLFEAVDEVLDIARQSGVRLEISHLKLVGSNRWGQSEKLLEIIREARAEGMDVTCDQYPFPASSTSLTAILPHAAHEGGANAMLERLKNCSEQLRADILDGINIRGGGRAILITGTHGYCPQYDGMRLDEIARVMGLPEEEAAIRLLIECHVSVAAVFFCMSEADMHRIMQEMFVCVGSDGYSLSFDSKYTKTMPHPRNFATSPRFLQIVREKKLMSPEDAVYKMTGLPAGILRLPDRGVIRENAVADLTIFDWETIGSRADFMNSKVRPDGIDYVLVNGEVAMRGGVLCSVRKGTVLLHS